MLEDIFNYIKELDHHVGVPICFTYNNVDKVITVFLVVDDWFGENGKEFEIAYYSLNEIRPYYADYLEQHTDYVVYIPEEIKQTNIIIDGDKLKLIYELENCLLVIDNNDIFNRLYNVKYTLDYTDDNFEILNEV